MSRRILVLSAAVGAGHLRAAEAVEAALRLLAPDATVKNLDVLALTNAAFRRVYGRTYFDLVNNAPQILGYVYDLLDRPPSARRKADRLRLLVERLNLGRLSRLLKSETWDVIVNTHFLPAEIIAALRRKGDLDTPQFTVTTDFETHRLWVNPPCEHYFTATEEGAAYLRHWGVAADLITVTGIPIHPVFSEAKSTADCRRRLGLGDDRPVILQLAGGFGLGPVEKLLRGVLSVARPLEVVVVSGRNEELRERLQQVEVPPRHRAKILGFTDQMDEWMAAADIVLSKPGGLTTSEVLARGAALVIANPIPGQETRNSDFLLENGAAIKMNNVATLPYKLTQLLDDPARLQRMKANARRLGRPRAAFDVASFALAWKAPTLSCEGPPAGSPRGPSRKAGPG
ncbi:MAG: glycosyltransferase [Thermoguttaceae bacterium]|jgi:processive 1,2-diacylglycerol beta-glucosyltransferase